MACLKIAHRLVKNNWTFLRGIRVWFPFRDRRFSFLIFAGLSLTLCFCFLALEIVSPEQRILCQLFFLEFVCRKKTLEVQYIFFEKVHKNLQDSEGLASTLSCSYSCSSLSNKVCIFWDSSTFEVISVLGLAMFSASLTSVFCSSKNFYVFISFLHMENFYVDPRVCTANFFCIKSMKKITFLLCK